MLKPAIHFKRCRRFINHACAALVCALALAAQAQVTPVNVTPSSFSVAMNYPELQSAELSVFADAGGHTNLAGTVGIEYYPVTTGDPAAPNSYFARQSRVALQQAARQTRLIYARVTRCLPDTTYYFQLRVTNTNNAQILIPSQSPLLSVKTSHENSLLPHAKQLIIQLPGDFHGQLMTLSHPNGAYKIASLVGDGVAPNEVFFNIAELFAHDNDTNLTLLGSQSFQAEMLGNIADVPPTPYSLSFNSAFLTADLFQDKSELLRLQIGTALLTIGQNGALPINFSAIRGVQSFTFQFDLPSTGLGNLAITPISPNTANFEALSPTHYRVTVTSPQGNVIQGTQQIAQVTFSTTPQPSVIIPVAPTAFTATRPDTTTFTDVLSDPGQIILVGAEPLLVADANPARLLTLYGTPGAGYEMQYIEKFQAPATWGPWTNISLSGLSQTFAARETTNQNIFFRARKTTP